MSDTTGTKTEAGSETPPALDKTRDSTSPPTGSLADGAHHAVDKIVGVAQQVASKVNKEGEELRLSSARMADICSKQVSARPFLFLGLAVGTGFLVGWLAEFFRQDH